MRFLVLSARRSNIERYRIRSILQLFALLFLALGATLRLFSASSRLGDDEAFRPYFIEVRLLLTHFLLFLEQAKCGI